MDVRPASTRISAVIPAYNREKTVTRAIDSALRQSRPPDEILVVDDGSVDQTRDVVAGYGSAVRYIHQRNQGASEARNTGVREAASPWIAFLDSDDFWLPDHLATMQTAIEETKGRAAFYFSDTRLTAKRGSRLLWDVSGFAIDEAFEVAEDATDWVMRRIQPMMLQSSVFERQRYLDHGGLRRSLRCRHDTHLFLRMGAAEPACAVAGCATEMTADGEGEGEGAARVTTAFGPGTRSYSNETVEMYRDVLDASDLRPVHRRELRERVAHAEIRLARFALEAGQLPSAALALGRAILQSPGAASSRAIGILRRSGRG